MKTVLAVTLLAFAAAQQSDNEYNYEAPEEQAVQEPQSYLQERQVAKVCVACDEFSPCWNGETCSGFTDYHAQTAEYESEFVKQDCPCGTIDTRHYRVQNKTILWVAFGLLFAPGLYFLRKGFHNVKHNEWNEIRIGCGIVNTVASLAYLTMALGYGFTTKCDGRDFYYARYVDWIITTPIMLYKYVQLAHGGDELTQIFLIVLDIFMIAAGLIGELVTGSERWAFFGFGMLTFIPILYILISISKSFLCCPGDTKDHSIVHRLYTRLVGVVTLAWIGYPIIWILANVNKATTACDAAGYAAEATVALSRTGVISVQGEAYAYTVLDIIAKTVAGYLMVSFDASEHAVPHTHPVHAAKGNSAAQKAAPAKKSNI